MNTVAKSIRIPTNDVAETDSSVWSADLTEFAAEGSTYHESLSTGHLFILDGRIIFSPNSRQIITGAVSLSSDKYATATDEKLFPIRADCPYVFDRELAWLPFVPIHTPFMEPLQDIGGPIAVIQCASGRERYPAYEFSPSSRKREWLTIEERLMCMIHHLVSHGRINDQKKQITLPLRPSTSGFAATAQSSSDMYADINKSRRRFIHLLACLSYLLNTDILCDADDEGANRGSILSSHDIRKTMLRGLNIPDDWMNTLLRSQNFRTIRPIRRLGVFLQLEETLKYGANIAFYVNCGIPVWYFWDAVAVEAVRKNSGLLPYAPLPRDVWRVLGEPRLFTRPVERMRLQIARLQAQVQARGRNGEWFYKNAADDETITTLFSPVLDYPSTDGQNHSHQIARTGMLVRLALPSWTYDDRADQVDIPKIPPTSTPDTNVANTPALHPIRPKPFNAVAGESSFDQYNAEAMSGLIDALRLRYGFVSATTCHFPTTSREIAQEQWTNLLKDVGFGFYGSLPIANKDDVAHFINAYTQSTTPPSHLSDMVSDTDHENLRQYIHTRLTFVSPNRYEIRPDPGKDLLVILRTAAHAMYACRLRLTSALSLARALLEVGVPFLTSANQNTTMDRPAQPINHQSHYSEEYTFTPEDYDVYLSRRAQCITRPEVQTALFEGGITWRLTIAAVPDVDTIVRASLDSRLNRNHVLHDVEQEANWDDLYGALPISTGKVNETQKYKKWWWPSGTMWRRGKRDIGFWTADDEEWYQRRVAEICTGKGKPLTASGWRDVLKRGPKNGPKIQTRNESVQREFLESLLGFRMTADP